MARSTSSRPGLARRPRKAPWRLAAFLAEANDLQVLRQRGGAYQFRHARLQDHLARPLAGP